MNHDNWHAIAPENGSTSEKCPGDAEGTRVNEYGELEKFVMEEARVRGSAVSFQARMK
jgi:hypothetical protein